MLVLSYLVAQFVRPNSDHRTLEVHQSLLHLAMSSHFAQSSPYSATPCYFLQYNLKHTLSGKLTQVEGWHMYDVHLMFNFWSTVQPWITSDNLRLQFGYILAIFPTRDSCYQAQCWIVRKIPINKANQNKTCWDLIST